MATARKGVLEENGSNTKLHTAPNLASLSGISISPALSPRTVDN